MEFRTTSKGGESHHVTTIYSGDTITITVTRIKLNGGHAKTITKVVQAELTFLVVMTSIAKIVELDGEVFDMVADHQKDNKDEV